MQVRGELLLLRHVVAVDPHLDLTEIGFEHHADGALLGLARHWRQSQRQDQKGQKEGRQS